MNERIKQIRRELGLTQQEFADRIGLKQNSIALIESGKRNISDQAVLSICREYGINEEWLRTGKGEKMVPDASDELEALVFLRVLLQSWISMRKWRRTGSSLSSRKKRRQDRLY